MNSPLNYTTGHVIYMGNNSEIQWRVLDKEKANNGEDGMFLMFQYLLEDKAELNSAETLFEKKEEAHTYKGSNAQNWFTLI